MYTLAYSMKGAHEGSIWCCAWGNINPSSENEGVNDVDNDEEHEVSSTSKLEECLVTASIDDNLKVWLVQDDCMKLYKQIIVKSLGIVALAVNEDCTICACTTLDSNLIFWDLLTGEKINEVNAGVVELWSVTFSPDNKHVITGGYSGKVNMFSVPDGVLEQSFDTNGKFVLSIAFSPDSKYIASGAVDGIINIFDVQTSKLTHTLEGHAMPIRTLSFSPTSDNLLTGSDDGHMKIYDVLQAIALGTVSGHASWVLSVSYSPDANYVVSSSADKCVKIWTAKDLKSIQVFKEHREQVWCAKYSIDASKMASVSEDGTINIYRLNTNEKFY